MMSTGTVVGLVVAGVCAAAGAQIYGPGAGFTIPDESPAGISSSIEVADDFTVAGVAVYLDGLTHTYAGDLSFTLTHGSTSVVFINRPGTDIGANGDSSNFGGDYVIAPGAPSLIAALREGNSSYVLPSGTYAPESPFDPFYGVGSAGTWTLTVSDHSFVDFGSLGGWRIELVPVPAPAGGLLLAAAAPLALRRRR